MKPITRQEKYLAYLNGDASTPLPEPITRVDHYLYNLCINGGGSGGGSGEMNKIDSIKVNGKTQDIAFDKSVDIKVPTELSELANDVGFVTQEDLDKQLAPETEDIDFSGFFL